MRFLLCVFVLLLSGCRLLAPPLNRISSQPAANLTEAIRRDLFVPATDSFHQGGYVLASGGSGKPLSGVQVRFRRLGVVATTDSQGFFFLSAPMRRAVRVYQDRVLVRQAPYAPFRSTAELFAVNPLNLYLSLPSPPMRVQMWCGADEGPTPPSARQRAAGLRAEYRRFRRNPPRSAAKP